MWQQSGRRLGRCVPRPAPGPSGSRWSSAQPRSRASPRTAICTHPGRDRHTDKPVLLFVCCLFVVGGVVVVVVVVFFWGGGELTSIMYEMVYIESSPMLAMKLIIIAV